MALTRKMLKAMGIEDDKIDQIIEAHTEVVDALKEQRDEYKEDAGKLPGVQKELEDLKAAGDGGFEKKYNDEHTAFESYKAQVAKEQETSQKDALYREVLKSCGIDPKRIDAIIRVTDLDKMALKDGKLVDVDKLAKDAKTEWAGFVVQKHIDGADVEDPPADGGEDEKDLGSMSMEDYIAARSKK